MGIGAIVFDLDDTLLDTSTLLDARDHRDWADVYRRLDEVRVFEVGSGEHDVTSLPAEMRNRGFPIGVYTHSPEKYATELMRTHGVRVDALVTGSDGFPSKPDPTGLIAVARELGVAPADCVYVGDSVGDFGAAAAAGMTSVGVSWARRTPSSWRHGWPDIAVSRPSRLLRFVDGAVDLGPLAEVRANGLGPAYHWGSVMRLGGAAFGLGRYFPMGDRRYPTHALSHMVLDAKNDAAATERMADVFAVLEGHLSNPPDVVVSVPPAPEAERDRFSESRAVLARLFGARDGVDALRMKYDVEDYKQTGRDARAGLVVDRFEATGELHGERVVLIDDVITSGSQTDACRAALRDAGAGPVSVIAASVTQDSLPEPCPACGSEQGGRIRTRRRHRDGKEFQGCSRWPDCWWSRNLPS